MKERLSSIMRKISGIVPALALMLAMQSASATCFYWLHQPDIPEELL